MIHTNRKAMCADQSSCENSETVLSLKTVRLFLSIGFIGGHGKGGVIGDGGLDYWLDLFDISIRGLLSAVQPVPAEHLLQF